MKNSKINLEETISQQIESQIRELAKKSVKSYAGLILAIGLTTILGASALIALNYFAYGWIVILILVFAGTYIMTYFQLDYYYLRIDKATCKLTKTIDSKQLRQEVINERIMVYNKLIDEYEEILKEKENSLKKAKLELKEWENLQ